MQESTQPGDSVEITDVDTAAQALLARFEQHGKPAVSDEQSTEQAEEAEAEEVEAVEADGEEITESEETDATDEEAEARFETLSELAEAAGMDQEEFLKNIRATVKVQGEQGEVTLSELIKGYQLESDYTRKNEAFLNQKKEWESQQEQARAELTAEFQKAGAAFRVAQNELTRDFNAINWDQLLESDSQQYLIKRQQFGERQASLDAQIQQATQQAQAYAEKQQQEQAQMSQQQLQKEEELLISALPSWSNVETRKAESAKVGEYLMNQGFNAEEVGNITDHRLIVLAQKAMQSDKVAGDTDVALKKVKKAPKLIKPNARQTPNQAKAARTAKLMQKAKATGRPEDIAAALISRRSK
jgi:hypothetical protein